MELYPSAKFVITAKSEVIDKLYEYMKVAEKYAYESINPADVPADQVFYYKLETVLKALTGPTAVVNAHDIEKINDNALKFASDAYGLQFFIKFIKELDQDAIVSFKIHYYSDFSASDSTIGHFYDPTGKYFKKFNFTYIPDDWENYEIYSSNDYDGLIDFLKNHGINDYDDFGDYLDSCVWEDAEDYHIVSIPVSEDFNFDDHFYDRCENWIVDPFDKDDEAIIEANNRKAWDDGK